MQQPDADDEERLSDSKLIIEKRKANTRANKDKKKLQNAQIQLDNALYYKKSSYRIKSLENNVKATEVPSGSVPVQKSTINSIGNYNNIYNEYNTYKYLIEYTTTQYSYKHEKSKKLPPSLYPYLTTLHKYGLIIIIKYVLQYIYTNSKNAENIELIKEVTDLIDNLNYKFRDNNCDKNLFIYYILAHLIQELIKNQINIYKKNSINELYSKSISPIITSIDTKIPINLLSIEVKEFNINLENCNLNLDELFIDNNYKYINHIYTIVNIISNEKSFILYPNDLNNINKLKEKYCININNDIINTLLKYNSSPYLTNNEGISAMFNIIINNNYELIQELHNQNINIHNIDNKLLVNYLLNENINNINKILTEETINETKLNDILYNINNNLYNNIQLLLLANNKYGNNILINLNYSFDIISYITLQYLSEHLININNNFNINDLQDILSIINIQISLKKISSNYLTTKLNGYGIKKKINLLIIKELIEINTENLKKLKKEFDEMKNNIKILRTTTDDTKELLAKKIEESSTYIDIEKKIKDIRKTLLVFNKYYNNTTLTKLIKKSYNITYKIIERYEFDASNNNINNSIIMEGWKRLIQDKSIDNYNLISLYLLEKQKKNIRELENNKLNAKLELEKINKAMKHLSLLCEDYFNRSEYTDNNKILKFIEDLLNYTTKIVLGQNIELTIRKILFTYFYNTLTDNTCKNIDNIIDYILNTELTGYDKNLCNYLYDIICPKLVKNCSEIFKNNAEKKGHTIESVRDILSNYFELLHLVPITLSDEIINIFKKDIINYYDIFVTKIIKLWHINIENIFTYIINNYRCLQTTLYLL